MLTWTVTDEAVLIACVPHVNRMATLAQRGALAAPIAGQEDSEGQSQPQDLLPAFRGHQQLQQSGTVSSSYAPWQLKACMLRAQARFWKYLWCASIWVQHLFQPAALRLPTVPQDDSLVAAEELAEPEQVLPHIWGCHCDGLVRAPAPAEPGSARAQPGLQGQRDRVPDQLLLLPVARLCHLQRQHHGLPL